MTSKAKSAAHYLVCPQTGLSLSLCDDYSSSSSLVYIKKHPLAANPQKLFDLIRKRAAELPNSYIIAGIFLSLSANDLIDHPELESPYCRATILARIESEPSYKLIKLFWAIYNTKAWMLANDHQITLNLSTVAGYKNAGPIMALLWTTALQNPTLADTVYNASQTTSAWAANSKAKNKQTRTLLTLDGKRAKQDPISARNRVTRETPGLTKLLVESPLQDQLSLESRVITKLLPTYHNQSIESRHHIAAALKAIYAEAIRISILDQDDSLAKSYRIMIDLVEGFEADPIEVSLDEEW